MTEPSCLSRLRASGGAPTPRGGVASPHSATEGCRRCASQVRFESGGCWSARRHIRAAGRRARVLIADACCGCASARLHRGSSREIPNPTPHVFSQLGARREHTRCAACLDFIHSHGRPLPAFLSRLLRTSTASALGSRLCIPDSTVAPLRLPACSIPYPPTDPRPIVSHEVLSLPHAPGCLAATSSPSRVASAPLRRPLLQVIRQGSAHLLSAAPLAHPNPLLLRPQRPKHHIPISIHWYLISVRPF